MKKLIRIKIWATSSSFADSLVALIMVLSGVTSAASLAYVGQRGGVVSCNLVNHEIVTGAASPKRYVKSGEQILELGDRVGAFSWFDRSRPKESGGASLGLDSGLSGVVRASYSVSERAHVEPEQAKNASIGAVFDFPIDLNDKVLAWVHQFTTKKRNFMEQTLSRASQYLPMVHQIFAEEHVPQDLAYLAVIESGFINSASSCANAVGMWQFMRSTGHIYGLSGNTWVEERRDPVKATRAAAKYLRQLYTVSGDWYLALVGYNAGPRAATRAIHNLGTRNFWDMHRSRWLRNQTKDYVPELCAAILIGRFPERYGLKVEQLDPYTYETIEVDRMTSLPVLAHYSGADVNKLKALNPELLRDTTPPGKYMLRVPLGMGSAVAHALANIPDDKRLNFTAYSISPKDKLSLVAARFNLSASDLLHINNITKDQFRPGLVIQVPPQQAGLISSKGERIVQPAKGRSPLATVAFTRGDAGVASSLSREKTLPMHVATTGSFGSRVTTKQLEAGNGRGLNLSHNLKIKQKTKLSLHIVKRGDSLFSISSQYGIELKNLKRLNKIKFAEIRVGQRLYLQ